MGELSSRSTAAPASGYALPASDGLASEDRTLPNRTASRSRYLPLVLTAIVGTLATAAAFLLVCSWEYRVAQIGFESSARAYVGVIAGDLGDADTLLYTIAAFMGADDGTVPRREFGRFTASLHRRVGGLRDTAWAPRVTLARRPAFEAAVRAEGFAGYRISQFGPRHQLVVATSRAVYYPLLYMDAAASKRPLMGLDLTSDNLPARAARRALTTGLPASSPPMDVVTVKQRGGGMLGYMPAYAGVPADRARLAVPRGLVLGVFDIPAMIEHIVAATTANDGLNLYLYNAAATGQRRVLFSTLPASPDLEHQLRAGAHYDGRLSLIDQPLTAIVTPAAPLRLVRLTLAGITTLVAGGTLTAAIVAYLLLALRRTLDLEALTARLQATTVRLHEQAREVTRISRHDALTSLPNRLLFGERLTETVARFGRGAPFTLLFLDLDRFKAVNDSLGHAAGDRVLCTVAERIRRCIREVDTPARLGGDEFAIILWDIADSATAAIVAKRLIASISEPYVIDDRSVHIGVSIGASIAGEGTTCASIVAEADLAMYEAKEAGRGTLRIFEQRMSVRADEHRSLEADLRASLERHELEVHYQPLVDLSTCKIVAFEALVRWRHPEHGLILPERFIRVAEEAGLIGELGRWVVQTACRDAAGWPYPAKVTINLSALQPEDPALLSGILQALATAGLPPNRLEVELTEPAALRHNAATHELIEQLHAVGATVALDDFGTGCAALTSVLDFGFDKIKIDRSVVAKLGTSPSSAVLIAAIALVASQLGRVTAAEGIETAAQLELLRDLGCSEGQGFLFAAATPNAALPELFARFDGARDDDPRYQPTF